MTENKPQSRTDSVFNAIDQQEIRQLLDISGIYVRGAVEDYKIDNSSGQTGFVQVLVKQRSDSARMKLETIKVREDCYGLIDLLNQSKSLRPVRLACELVTFGQRSNIYLVSDQPHLKVA